MIDSSVKAAALSKLDPKAVPDQRVSAVTPASVRFFKGNPLQLVYSSNCHDIVSFTGDLRNCSTIIECVIKRRSMS